MKKLTLAVMVMVSSVANAQITGPKAGLWETKLVHQVIDGRDMTEKLVAAQAKMQAAMAKMTPEQRQKMEAMMKGMGTQGSSGAMRVCISPAMAAKHAVQSDPNSRCPATKLTTNGNKTSFSFNCTNDGRTTVGSGQSTVNGDVISNHMESTTTDASGSHTVLIDSEMTYLGSDCQGITPIDQLAKGMEASGK